MTWRGPAVAIALMAAVALVAVSLSRTIAPPRDERLATIPPASSTPRPPGALGKSVAPPVEGTPSGVSSALQREYVVANDLYAFAVHARSRPEEGGRWYAMDAMMSCADLPEPAVQDAEVARSIAAHATVSPRQVETGDRYRRRCAGFTPGSIAEMRQWLQSRAKAKDDPLYNIAFELSGARDRDAKVLAIQHLLDARDPLLLSTMWRYLQDVDHVDGGKSTGWWFEGHAYHTKDEWAPYEVALEIAVCQPNLPCAGARFADYACMLGGECDELRSGIDFARIDFATVPAVDATVLKLASRIRDAIARGDLDAFRAPRATR